MARVALTMMLAGLAALLAAAPAGGQSDDPAKLLRAAIAIACEDELSDLADMARQLPGGATGLSHDTVELAGTRFGWRRLFRLDSGAGLEINRVAPGGRLRRLHADYLAPWPGGPRPAMTAIAGPDCVVHHGRRLSYGKQGSPETLELLDSGLAPTGEVEPLNPPVPAGQDPGGVTVALVDSGVNYLLPEIARSLARDAEGRALGYDFWDLDERPFDANPARSPFFPQRHGTRVASVLLDEAPRVRLIPYRYPRPDLSRMARLVRDAAAKGARVVGVSLGSNRRDEWASFEAAAEAAPEILFVVSAGNNGRDIDQTPVYPAALELDNMIVVSSADGFGDPAPGANWGTRTVDLLVPGERIPVIDFRGQPTRASGSSFAAPRVVALAARLLARHPEWDPAALKNAIFARATMSDAGGPPRVSQGLIADPRAD